MTAKRTYERNGLTITILETADDVTPDVLARAEETVDWFDNEPTMPTEDFLDRMFRRDREYDLEEYDNPAARTIMRHARKIRRDRNEI